MGFGDYKQRNRFVLKTGATCHLATFGWSDDSEKSMSAETRFTEVDTRSEEFFVVPLMGIWVKGQGQLSRDGVSRRRRQLHRIDSRAGSADNRISKASPLVLQPWTPKFLSATPLNVADLVKERAKATAHLCLSFYPLVRRQILFLGQYIMIDLIGGGISLLGVASDLIRIES